MHLTLLPSENEGFRSDVVHLNPPAGDRLLMGQKVAWRVHKSL